MGRCGNLGRCFPLQVKLWLRWNGVAFSVKFRLSLDRIALLVPQDLVSLLELTLERVAILEEPGTGALRLVVLEVALEVEAVRVDPLSRLKLAIFPLSIHLHARLLE